MSIDELLAAYHGFDPSTSAARSEPQAATLARHRRPVSLEDDAHLPAQELPSRRFGLRRSA